MEGGHSHRRIIHAADRTGRAISEVLTEKPARRPNIELFTHRVAVDLVLRRAAARGPIFSIAEHDRVDLFQARR